MFAQIDEIINVIDDAVWGLPLICLIMVTGILLTARLGRSYRSGISEKLSNLCLKMKKTDMEK